MYLLKENDEIVQGKGRKRAAPRGRGRGSTSKRGRKSDNSSLHKVFLNKLDDDDDDADDIAKRFNMSQPRVSDCSSFTYFCHVQYLFCCSLLLLDFKNIALILSATLLQC